MTEEGRRLEEARHSRTPWKKWGPYLAERQWGTAREDYSDTGNAWDCFGHDQARSRAFCWGEDGLADLMNPRTRYERDGGDLARQGLYLDLPPWGHHVFEVIARG